MKATPSAALRGKVANAPQSPGCYLFFDRQGRIIYIGKSKLLRNRVRQYFHEAAAQDDRTKDLVREIYDVEYRITPTELEALVLEYCLIKRHKPWFNSQHIRDTAHPYLRIDQREDYPTLSIADKPYDDAGYYGMFADRYDAQDAIELISRVWKTPRCGRASFVQVDRPCIFYDMKHCTGPCCGVCGAEAYREAIDDIVTLLSGKHPLAQLRLEDEMRGQAARLAFEEAGETKALLDRLGRIQRKCGRSFRVTAETNAAVFMRAYGEAAVSAFGIRKGAVCAHAVLDGEAADERLDAFIGEVRQPGTLLSEAEWLPGCLMEIYAHKALVTFDSGDEHGHIADRLRAGYRAISGETK